MISRMLEEAGLFMGVRKQHDHEALFFLEINDWLFRQCGASWDNPEAFKYFLENDEVRSLAGKYIKYIMRSPRVTGYLGIKNYLTYRSPEKLDKPWGWKDPRNTFTLPLWTDIFPDAKVVHICRNGIDVAHSLKVREKKQFAKRSQPVMSSYKKIPYIFRPKRGGFTDSLRCSSLNGSFLLWEEYLSNAQKHVKRLGDRAFEVKYEDFIEKPVGDLKRLFSFCGLSVSNEEIDRIGRKVIRTRSNAFMTEPELREFSEQVTSRLCNYGY